MFQGQSAQLASGAAGKSQKRRLRIGDCIWRLVTLTRTVGVDADDESLVGRESKKEREERNQRR